jgi:hypothetical protein
MAKHLYKFSVFGFRIWNDYGRVRGMNASSKANTIYIYFYFIYFFQHHRAIFVSFIHSSLDLLHQIFVLSVSTYSYCCCCCDSQFYFIYFCFFRPCSQLCWLPFSIHIYYDYDYFWTRENIFTMKSECGEELCTNDVTNDGALEAWNLIE